MGATCTACNKDMLKTKGCTYTHILYKGKFIKRDTSYWQNPGERCHDCGALAGQPHHPGCDIERCPVCGQQFIGCDCFADSQDVILGTVKKPKTKKSA